MRDIVCIGASAGGLDPVRTLVSQLPRDLAAAVFVVIHVSPYAPTVLHEILGKASDLEVRMAKNRDRVRPGVLYLPPPDHHLLVQGDHVRVVRGPRENGSRPAIDPLFRSAAASFGKRVIGIVLSGSLRDGTAGLVAIRDAGGITMVQSPEGALYPAMPLSALAKVDVDHVLTPEELAAAVVRHVGAKPRRIRRGKTWKEDPAEIQVDRLPEGEVQGTPTRFTCPECGGSLSRVESHDVFQFRCFVGHAYSAETLLEGKDDNVERALWTALRALEETAALRRRMAERAGDRWPELAKNYRRDSRSAQHAAGQLRELLLRAPAKSPKSPRAKRRGRRSSSRGAR